MDLGWLDVCLRVSAVASSRAFYEGLGFRAVEGSDEDGWAVVVQGDSRIGLYEPRFMESSPFSLNFRGSNLALLVPDLEGKGYQFDDGVAVSEDTDRAGAAPTPNWPRRHPRFVVAAIVLVVAATAFVGITGATGLEGPGWLHRYPYRDLGRLADTINAEAGELRTPDDCWRTTPSTDDGRASGSRSRQRMTMRSMAGSRSRTCDEGAETLPLAC